MKTTPELQKRIFDYLKTVEKASSRKIARALGENRHKVKLALQAMTETGVLENLGCADPDSRGRIPRVVY